MGLSHDRKAAFCNRRHYLIQFRAWTDWFFLLEQRRRNCYAIFVWLNIYTKFLMSLNIKIADDVRKKHKDCGKVRIVIGASYDIPPYRVVEL